MNCFKLRKNKSDPSLLNDQQAVSNYQSDQEGQGGQGGQGYQQRGQGGQGGQRGQGGQGGQRGQGGSHQEEPEYGRPPPSDRIPIKGRVKNMFRRAPSALVSSRPFLSISILSISIQCYLNLYKN